MALTKIGATLGGSADVTTVTQSSHGLLLGYPVKMTSSGYAHATANTTANAEAVGIVIASDWNGSSGANTTFTLASSGRITTNGCVPNLTAGTVLFLQVSAGLLAAAEPSSVNQVSKPMAVVTVADSEMIMIQQRGEVIGTSTTTIADDSITSAKIVDGAIVNADVNTSAAVAFSKLADLADGNILVGNGSNVATSVNPSGDIDVSNTGAFTIANDAVTTDKLANSINTEIAANTAKTGITSGQANAITANTAKVTNATHTGDVTGATALTIATDAVDIGMLSASGTADATTFLRGDNAWAAAGGALQTTIVTGSRTASAGSGSQAITGAGFAPTGFIVVAAASTRDIAASIGFIDDAGNDSVFEILESTAKKRIITTRVISHDIGTANAMTAEFTSMDSDGCTITWTKSGVGMDMTFHIWFLR
jgi:hypothetical protein